MPEKKIFFLYANYAYKKSAKAIASQIKACSEAQSMLFFKISTESDFAEIAVQFSLENEIVFFCCGGRLLNRCLNILNNKKINCLKLSLFPGIVLHNQIDAFLTRLRADFVLMNSKADFEYYKFICNLLGIKCNGFEYGPSWLFKNILEDNSNHKNKAIYWEQLHVPATYKEKRELLNCLLIIAKNNPQYTILVKSRPLENYAGHTLISLMREEKSSIPINLKSIAEEDDVFLNEIKTSLAISSSAVLDAIHAEHNIFLLKEFKKTKYFCNFFAKTKIYKYSNDINLDKSNLISEKWLEKNYINPDNSVENLIKLIFSESSQSREVTFGKLRLFLVVSLVVFNDFLNIPVGIKKIFKAYKTLHRN